MTWSSPESMGEPDEVGFGSARPPGRRWPRGPDWARWPLIFAGAVVIAVAAVLALGRHPARSDPARSAVTVTQASHRLLGVRARRWELLGYGSAPYGTESSSPGAASPGPSCPDWTATGRSRSWRAPAR